MRGMVRRWGDILPPLIAAAFAVGLSACGGGASPSAPSPSPRTPSPEVIERPGPTVPTTNEAPVADAGTNRTADGGASVTLDGGGSSDPEGGPLTFAWAQTGGTPGVALAGADTARATFTAPNVGADAELTFTLTVTDPGGLSAGDTVMIGVRSGTDRPVPGGTPVANEAPTANAGNNRTVDGGASVTLDGGGSVDPEGGLLTFAWVQTGGTPRVALAGADTARATFRAPNPGTDAELTFALTVTDPDGMSADDTVTIRVRAVNDRPAANEAPTANAGSNRTVNEGASVTLDGGGSSDPEDGPLAFAWTQTGGTPRVALAGADTARATFRAPNLKATEELTFALTVTDPDGLSAGDGVTIRIRADNDRPTANAGPDRTVDEGTPVTLDGGGSVDPEGGLLTFAWAQTDVTPGVALAGADTARATFTAPDVGADAELTFALTVTDPDGLSSDDGVTIRVRGANDAPTASAGPNITVDEGDTATLDGGGSVDPEGGTLTFAWVQTGGTPEVTLAGADTARATFAAPNLSADAELTFALTVTDPDGLSSGDTVTVGVRADNDPPTARAGADVTIGDGDPVTLDGGGSSDPEGGTTDLLVGADRGNAVGDIERRGHGPSDVLHAATRRTGGTDVRADGDRSGRGAGERHGNCDRARRRRCADRGRRCLPHDLRR